jgi:hypothetical protein
MNQVLGLWVYIIDLINILIGHGQRFKYFFADMVITYLVVYSLKVPKMLVRLSKAKMTVGTA